MTKSERANPALTHLGESGEARMVDVGGKPVSLRTASAEAWVRLGRPAATYLKQHGAAPKGNVLETARLAGIMAAKRTAELIPLCHPLSLDLVEVLAEMQGDCLRFEARVKTEGKTGVEMEAMTAAAVAALAAYDMVKSLDKGAEIGPVRLLGKTGGKSGVWWREDEDAPGDR